MPCGPRRYLYKERLWPHLDSFLDAALAHIRRVGRVPDLVHGHYADAGYVGTRLSHQLNIPLIHTGHSLGRTKRQSLLASGMKRDDIEQRYNISRRIDAEEQGRWLVCEMVQQASSCPEQARQMLQNLQQAHRRLHGHQAGATGRFEQGTGHTFELKSGSFLLQCLH